MDDVSQPPLPLDWPEATPPPEVDDPVAGLRADLAKLRDANASRYHALSRPGPDGRRAVPDPLSVLALRLAVAVEHLFTDEEARLRFDLAFEQQMAHALTEQLSHRRQADLVAPVTKAGSGLFIPRS